MKRAFVLDNGFLYNGIIVTCELEKEEIIEYVDKEWKAMPKKKELKEDYIEHLCGNVKARTHDLRNGWIHLELRKWKTTNRNIGCFTHELLHCASFLFRSLNIEFNDSTEEVWAYLLSYWTEYGLDALKSKDTIYLHKD